MKTATPSRASSASSAARSLNGTNETSGRSGPNRSRATALPFTESEPSVSPWKPFSTATTRGRRVAARPSLIAASTASVPVLTKRTRSVRAGATATSASASSPGRSESPSCGRLGVSSSSSSAERRAHSRVVAADVVHPEPAEPVQELRPVPVVEVGALGPRPLPVEADDLEDLDEARVRVAPVERHPSPARSESSLPRLKPVTGEA